MAYQYQFINKLEQFGYVSYDLVLTDDAGVMPDVRTIKEFKTVDAVDLDNIGSTEANNATKLYQDNITRQWVISQIQEASNFVNNYIQSAAPDLTTLNNVQAVINPVLNFYGLPALTGIQPILINQLNIDTNTIIKEFNQLPVTENTIPATQYFISMVKQALGES